MTRKERILAALRREPVDRVPHVTYNLHPYGGHANDPSYAEILAKVEATAGMAIKVGAGGEGVGFSRARAGQGESTTVNDASGSTVTHILHTPKGDLTSVTRAPLGEPSMCVKHLIESDEDIERYLSLPYEPPVYDTSGARAVSEAVGDKGIVLLCFTDPMCAMASLFHFEEFCMRTLTDLPSLVRMIDWAFERCVENTKLLTQACAGMDCVFHVSGPEYCTPPMVAPEVFSKLVTPYMRKLIEIIHGAGMLAMIHCHGRVREVLPEMIATGTDGLEPLEPPPQGNITLAELIDQVALRQAQDGGGLCLMGYIQDQELYTAPPGHMTRWVEQIAATVKGRTGYIMSPTCTPFDFPCTDTYRRNYLEWLEAAERVL